MDARRNELNNKNACKETASRATRKILSTLSNLPRPRIDHRQFHTRQEGGNFQMSLLEGACVWLFLVNYLSVIKVSLKVGLWRKQIANSTVVDLGKQKDATP